jgi:hypothetical protein
MRYRSRTAALLLSIGSHAMPVAKNRAHRLRRTAQVTIVLIGVAYAAVAFAQAARLRNGAISKFSGVDQTLQVCTTSQSYVNMPDMTRTFIVSGTTSKPAVVLFQGSYWSASLGDWAVIQLTIDNVPNPGPGSSVFLYMFAADGDGYGSQFTSHGFNFQTNNLPPGSHTARIRWRAIGTDAQVCIGSRSMLVLYD